jgi:hypothetical protein
MTTLHVETPNRRSPLRCGFFVLPIALLWFALSSALQAVNPPPDGGYGNQNTAEGTDALFSLTSGVWNVAVGFQALFHDTTGKQNTAVGYKALFSNISGDKSTAYGSQALLINTTGTENVATGFSTLSSNISGNRNTGVGYRTLAFNDADDNTAIGWNGLFNNRTGVQNTAIGSGALLHGSTFSDNTAVGFQALNNNGIDGNTAVGSGALFTEVNSPQNVAVGTRALEATSGTNGFNVAVGFEALDEVTTGGQNTAVGDEALGSLVTGTTNTAVGDLAGFNHTGSDSGNIDIGAFVFGVSGESFTTRIGNIYSTIQPAVGVNPDFVTINSTGRLGRANISSRRYKHEIKPMDKASEKLYALKPVSFRYNKEYDATQTIAFGLIAEDVAEVYPDLVGRNERGQPESVRYEQINAMLLNEFLKEHKKVEEQQASIADLKSTVALQQKEMQVLTAQLKEQAGQIQKVSAQLETLRSVPQTVATNP